MKTHLFWVFNYETMEEKTVEATDERHAIEVASDHFAWPQSAIKATKKQVS